MDYIAIDFETANSNLDSACSIGIVGVENDKVLFQKHYLINPLAEFNPYNIAIHNIRPEDVLNSPTFKEIWEEIKEYFNGVVIAHNANFDLSVLKKLIEKYELDIPNIKIACTLKISQKLWKGILPNCKLNTVSNYLEVDHNHHNALSDVRACKEIFEHLVEEYSIDDEDDRYSISSVRNDNNIIPAEFTNLKKIGVSKYWNEVKARVYPPYFTMFKDVDISENPFYDEVDLETLLYATMKNRGEDSYTKIVKEYNTIQKSIFYKCSHPSSFHINI